MVLTIHGWLSNHLNVADVPVCPKGAPQHLLVDVRWEISYKDRTQIYGMAKAGLRRYERAARQARTSMLG